MNLPPFIAQHIDQLYLLCDKHHVDKLYAFGSVLTNRFDQKHSDVDLQVELLPMSPIEKGETLLTLWDEFETLLNKKVDLLTDQPIRNRFLSNRVIDTRQLIYDRSKKEIPV